MSTTAATLSEQEEFLAGERVPGAEEGSPEMLPNFYNLLTNESTTRPSVESISKYYPESTSLWMYAMIALGSAFIIFFIMTIYLLFKPEKERRRPYQSVNS